MTDEGLQPFVRDLLEEAIEDRGLSMEVAETMLERAKLIEGQELEETIRDILKRRA